METALEYTTRLAELLRVERGITADFLLTLADFDRKKLWRQLDHTSLFNYLHLHLKLSKSAAHARTKAAELIQAYPEVEPAIRRGDLCLSSLAELAAVLTPENRADVLPRFFGLSRREAAFVAASIRPAAVIPTRTTVTTLRPPAVSAASSRAEPLSLAVVLPAEPDSPVRDGDVRPAEPAAPAAAQGGALALQAAAPREAVKPLDAERARLSVTVTRNFLAKLDAAKDALGHAIPEGNAAAVLERGLDLVLAEHAKRRGLVEKPRTSRPSSNPRHVPAAVKREVWTRAGGRCEFVLASGERCGCTRRLEYDHVTPVALGGTALDAADVRLCCREHNQLAARRTFGDAVMDGYARASR